MSKVQGSNRGFSVVQMLLMLVGITLFVWYFSPETFTQFLGKKIDSSAAVFQQSMRNARSYAQNHETIVTFCKSDDGLQCKPKLRWQEGWMYFSDVNGNGKVDSPDDKVIKTSPAVTNGVSINSVDVILSSVTFAAAGHTLSKKGNPVAGKFVICDGFVFNDSSRIVSFNYQGTIHVESPRDGLTVGCGG